MTILSNSAEYFVCFILSATFPTDFNRSYLAWWTLLFEERKNHGPTCLSSGLVCISCIAWFSTQGNAVFYSLDLVHFMHISIIMHDRPRIKNPGPNNGTFYINM
jgi:hypothetical protein